MTLRASIQRLPIKQLSRWLKPLIYLVVFIFLAIALANGWDRVKDYQWQFKPGLAVLAMIVFGVYVLAVGTLTVWIVRRFSLPLPYRAGLGMSMQAYIARYIPGGVWPFASVAATGRELNLPSSMLVVALILKEMFVVWVSACFALPLIFIHFQNVPLDILALVGLAASLVLAPFLLRTAIHRLVRWRKVSVEVAIDRITSFRGFFLILLVFAAVQVLYLLASCLFLMAVTDFTLMELLYGALAMNGAWLFGLIVLPAPQGIGAREAALVFLLLPFVAAPVAIALSLGFRLMTTLVDLVFFLAMLLISARRKVVPVEEKSVTS